MFAFSLPLIVLNCAHRIEQGKGRKKERFIRNQVDDNNATAGEAIVADDGDDAGINGHQGLFGHHHHRI